MNTSPKPLKDSASMLTGAVATTTGTLASAALVPLFVFFFLLYRDFFDVSSIVFLINGTNAV
ncbi:MAG: hypothetical protein R2822_16870 [Spirosomataceae bacterium]